jgi:hypothetical protein
VSTPGQERSNVNALFTSDSLVSLQGSTAAALLVPNVLVHLVGSSFAPFAKWVAFGIAMSLALLVANRASETGRFKWIVAVLNGFLIFASAVGINQVAFHVESGEVSSTPPQMVSEQPGAEPPPSEEVTRDQREAQPLCECTGALPEPTSPSSDGGAETTDVPAQPQASEGPPPSSERPLLFPSWF